LETIQEEEEQEQEIEELRIKKWDKEDKMGNLQDPYNKL